MVFSLRCLKNSTCLNRLTASSRVLYGPPMCFRHRDLVHFCLHDFRIAREVTKTFCEPQPAMSCIWFMLPPMFHVMITRAVIDLNATSDSNILFVDRPQASDLIPPEVEANPLSHVHIRKAVMRSLTDSLRWQAHFHPRITPVTKLAASDATKIAAPSNSSNSRSALSVCASETPAHVGSVE